MREQEGGLAVAEEPQPELLEFNVQDVTSTRQVRVQNVQRGTPAGVVAKALAARMGLPDDAVPWTLRLDSSSAYLDDNRPIGEQVTPGAKTTLTPKTHLG